MFLIIEIVLTIVAIVKGWKWWKALLPLTIGVIIGFIVGTQVRPLWYPGGGLTLSDAKSIGLVLDIILIIILVAMIYFNPKKQIDQKVGGKIKEEASKYDKKNKGEG